MLHDTGCRFVLVLALCVAAAPAQAQFSVRTPSNEDYHVEVGASFWTPDPEVTLRFGAGGPDVDLIGLFEIESRRFTDFRAIVKPARKHKIRVAHVEASYQKDKTFQFTWDVWRIGYEWDVVSGSAGFLGVIGELKFNHIVTNISSTPISASASADHKAPIPAIGGIVRGYISKNTSLTAEGTRLDLNGQGDEHVDFVDYDLYVSQNLGRHFSVLAGYRSMTIDYLIDDDAGKLKMKGPYWGALLRF